MSKLFDQDNMFFAIMGVLFDLIILNVLTLLCCLPVVTAGASFAAAVACVPAGGDCAGGRRHARPVHGVDARAADGVRRVHGIGDYCDCAVLLPAAFSL